MSTEFLEMKIVVRTCCVHHTLVHIKVLSVWVIGFYIILTILLHYLNLGMGEWVSVKCVDKSLSSLAK